MHHTHKNPHWQMHTHVQEAHQDVLWLSTVHTHKSVITEGLQVQICFSKQPPLSLFALLNGRVCSSMCANISLYFQKWHYMHILSSFITQLNLCLFSNMDVHNILLHSVLWVEVTPFFSYLSPYAKGLKSGEDGLLSEAYRKWKV